MTKDINDIGLINFKKDNRHQNRLSFLAIIIAIELVLGGSGRLITFGSFFSIRYILFFIAIFYFTLNSIFNNYRIKKNMFNFDITLFFYMFIFAIANGIVNGYAIGDVIKSSQGYLYLLIFFPITLLIDNKEKSKKIFAIIINSSVVLALMSIIVFVIYYFDSSMYSIFTPILDKLDYGYIAYRGGLPAVFFKTSPFIAISFVLLLVHYINLKKDRNIFNIFKLSILLFGIITTMSMGLWIGTFVGIILTIMLARGKNKLFGITVVLILISIAYYLSSDYISSSIINRLSSDDSSFIIKYDQFFMLVKNWFNRFLFGNGFGIEITFLTEFGKRTMINFELFWLQLLVNMGLVGLIIYAKIFIKSIYYSFKRNDSINFKDSIHIKSLIIGLVVLAIISSVNPFLNNPIGIGYLVIVMNTVSNYWKENSLNENRKVK